MASSSRSWCVACTLLLGECTKGCVFAPYCPPEDPLEFLIVHKVFGPSNVAKNLSDLPAEDRKKAVIEIAYEAITRLKDPLSACLAAISVLQQQRRHLLYLRNELSAYSGHAASSALPHPHNSGCGGGGVSGGTPFGIPSTLVARQQTQMLLPQNKQQAIHNQHIAAAISNYEQQETWNSMFSMDGGGAGSSVLTVVRGLCNLMSMVDGMPSSSNNPFGAQPAESDHQNPQVSPAEAGAASVHHHHLSLQQQILQHQQQLYLQQQQGQVWPAAAGATSVHHHHLSLQQQQEGQEPALHLKDAERDKHSVMEEVARFPATSD